VIVLVWEDFAEIHVSGTRRKLAVNDHNRIIAFVEDDERDRIVLISDNESILGAYEKLLETRGQETTCAPHSSQR
jgi:hypothetical protein